MTDLALVLVSNATVVAVIGFLMKALINRQLDRENAKFQANLQASADREMEQFRARLDRERLRLQISYGGIFEKQANAVLDLYRSAVEFRAAAVTTMDIPIEEESESRAFRECWRRLHNCYITNRVLLPDDLDRKCREFVDDFYSKVFQHKRLHGEYGRVRSEGEFDRINARGEALRAAVDSAMPALLDEIVALMRVLLGTTGREGASD